MLSKEQIEQIVQMTIAQMNNQQPASAPQDGVPDTDLDDV